MLDTVFYYIEDPGLQIVFFIFALGLSLRLLFFIGRLSYSEHTAQEGNTVLMVAFYIVRSLVPYHKKMVKAPVYTILRYLFHLCIFTVPIWFSGHVAMWEESSLEWYWTPISDGLADYMTLAVMIAGAWFFVRRILIPEIRRNSTLSDFIIICLTVLPFATGYFYTHGTFDHIEFLSAYMWRFHIISGEAMLVMIFFLYCVVRLDQNRCVGCDACTLSCPTHTLESETLSEFRVFKYSHYQCICCGSCVNACPEQAAQLRHEMGLFNLFKIVSKRKIRQVELAACEQCGDRFAPLPQLGKLNRNLHRDDIEISTLNLCQRCKKLRTRKNDLTHEVHGLASGLR